MASPDLAWTPPKGANPPPALLGAQTAGTLLSNIVRVYRQHFGVLMACSLLPVLPCLLWMRWLETTQSPWLPLAAFAYMLAAFVSGGAMTVAVSDLCVGNAPSVRRAYERILSHGKWWQILWTGFLIGLAIWVGFIALILPGLWVMSRGLLTSIVVVLEGRSGKDAIKRSFALTKGQAWRVGGLLLLPLCLAYLALIVVLIPFAVVMGESAAELELIAMTAALVLMAPVIGITMVLLYYDQRVRREAYDVQTLAEDLMR